MMLATNKDEVLKIVIETPIEDGIEIKVRGADGTKGLVFDYLGAMTFFNEHVEITTREVK